MCLIAGETFQVRVTFEDYRDRILDYGIVKFYALASVLETKQCWSEEDDFQLEKPKLDVQVLGSKFAILCSWHFIKRWLTYCGSCSFQQIRGTPQVGQDSFVTFSFMNPLSVSLTDCEFSFEGTGLVRPQTIKYRWFINFCVISKLI